MMDNEKIEERVIQPKVKGLFGIVGIGGCQEIHTTKQEKKDNRQIEWSGNIGERTFYECLHKPDAQETKDKKLDIGDMAWQHCSEKDWREDYQSDDSQFYKDITNFSGHRSMRDKTPEVLKTPGVLKIGSITTVYLITRNQRTGWGNPNCPATAGHLAGISLSILNKELKTQVIISWRLNIAEGIYNRSGFALIII